MIFRSIVLAVALICALGPASDALAATLIVNNHSASPALTDSVCTHAGFTGIQAAVNAARPRDTIHVCPGTYTEPVRIDKPLTIRGIMADEQSNVVIAPATTLSTADPMGNSPVRPIILVDGVADVHLYRLIVDGSHAGTAGYGNNYSVEGWGPVEPSFIGIVGIYYRNASGEVEHCVVRNINLSSNIGSDVGAGLGIYVDSGSGQSASLEAESNEISSYDKNGITALGAGTRLLAFNNYIVGLGSQTNIAQNGIQISDKAQGAIERNHISNNLYGTCNSSDCSYSPFIAANIFVYNSSGVRVDTNSVNTANVNILVVPNANVPGNVVVAENSITDSAGPYGGDGIDIFGNGNHVEHNDIFSTASTAVSICGSNNQVEQNWVKAAQVGVFLDANFCSGMSGNTIGGNIYADVASEHGTVAAATASRVRSGSRFLLTHAKGR